MGIEKTSGFARMPPAAMLEFSDQEYRFFEPKPNRFVEGMLRWLNRRVFLPGQGHRMTEVVVRNPEAVNKALRQAGNRLLFLPNHPTHSDPHVMSEVFRQLKTRVSFMAAYDVFLRSKFSAWCMQRMGCFSVDREGSDRASMKQALNILKEGEHSLVIFPEGNVYLMNDCVTPFLDGPAFIGQKAQKDLGDKSNILAIPVSIKVTHLTDARPAVKDLLRQLASEVGANFDEAADPVAEVKRLGWLALGKVMTALGRSLPEDAGSDLSHALRDTASEIILKLERELELSHKDGEDLTDRIRKIRRNVHSLRIAEEPILDDAKACSLAADAMLAYRLVTYPGTYLEENPTLDRMAETVEKIFEDFRSAPLAPYAPRRAMVTFGEPIDFLVESRLETGRALVANLTQRFEKQVQAGIDALNAENDCPGAEPFTQANQ